MSWHLFGVHILTASGAALALLAALSTFSQNWQATFVFIGLSLFVDAIDGPLARRLGLGAALDYVIDYTTYVFVPAIIIANSGLLEFAVAQAAAILIAVTGAIYFADRRMKQPDNSFRGFPAVWNMPVFVLFAVQPPEWVTVTAIVLLCIFTFLPIHFVHPNRVIRWRSLTLAVTAVWSAAAVWIVAVNFESSPVAHGLLLVSSAYLFSVSAIQQLTER